MRVIVASTAGAAFELVIYGALLALCLGVGLRFWNRYCAIVDTPTSACAAVVAGRNVVVGRVRPGGEMVAPISGRPCAWYRWSVERRGDRAWQTVEQRESRAPFVVADASGGILVQPHRAKVDIRIASSDVRPAGGSGVMFTRRQLRELAARGGDETAPPSDRRPRPAWVDEAAAALLTRVRGRPSRKGDALAPGQEPTADTPLGSLPGAYRISEARLEAGEDVFALGHVHLREDTAAPELADTGQGHELLVSTRTVRNVARRDLLLTVLLVYLASFYLMTGIAQLEPKLAVLITAVFASVLYGVRAYNRLVAVREQAVSAWSMIDIALQRRHDLLPNLLQVAREHAHRQEEVTAAVAQGWVDTRPADGRRGALPSEDAVVRATALDRADGRSARSLIALADAWPSPSSDAVFLDLAGRVTTAEDQVVYAQRFYNDAVTVLHERRRQFPGALLAPLVPAPATTLFGTPPHQGQA